MIGRFAGPDEQWLLAPKGLLLDRFHLWGCLVAFLGVLILVGSKFLDFLAYGIIVATLLMVVDAVMIFRALRDCER
jgi:hypothetical protein